MIGKLTGAVDQVMEDGIVLDVNGVGYVVQCSAKTLARLPAAGGAASLHVETTVKEDRIVLYGFADRAERDWFRLLMTVQGVGAKTALSILSALSPEEARRAISAEDKAAIGRADGVGPKLAARVLHELKDKVGAMALGAPARGGAAQAPSGKEKGAGPDAVSALVNLGYGRSEAYAAVAHALERLGADAALPDLVRAGLKELAA
jgi:Holliday junction DNA helicase RuvA